MALKSLWQSVPMYLLLASFLLVAASPTNYGQFCKAVPGTATWPSQDTWQALNQTLHGQLLAPSPPALVCDESNPQTYDNASCSQVSKNWFNSSFHAEDPVSVDWPNWQDDACIPPIINTTTVCDLKPFPFYVVNATEPCDIAGAVKFALKNNVRLSVKGTGHDFLSRSTAPGLSIWTNHLKGMTRHTSFTPQGCLDCVGEPAVTIRSGHRFREIYRFAQDHNFTVVGGADANVGMGGYFTGGGHSLMSGKYGLQVDTALELEVVTPLGDIVVANAHQHEDLFWAMKGGGGATFGVLVSITLRTFPTTTVTNFLLSVNSTQAEASQNNNTNFFSIVAHFHTLIPQLSESGLSGYYYMNPVDALENSGGYPAGKSQASGPTPQSLFLAGSFLNATYEYVENTMSSFMQTVNSTEGLNVSMSIYPPVPLYSSYATEAGFVGVNVRVGSRLWDKDALSNSTKLESTLRTFDKYGLSGLLVSVPAVRAVDPDVSSVNPAWRRAYLHLVTASSWPFYNATAEQLAADELTNVKTAALRNHAPDMGCYLNEADTNEPNWQHAFWGDHYERLLQIKRKLDPFDVFWCPNCVGSERWELVKETGEICPAN